MVLGCQFSGRIWAKSGTSRKREHASYLPSTSTPSTVLPRLERSRFFGPHSRLVHDSTCLPPSSFLSCVSLVVRLTSRPPRPVHDKTPPARVLRFQELPLLTRAGSYCNLKAHAVFATSDVFFNCFSENETFGDWEFCMERKVRAFFLCTCTAMVPTSHRLRRQPRPAPPCSLAFLSLSIYLSCLCRA